MTYDILLSNNRGVRPALKPPQRLLDVGCPRPGGQQFEIGLVGLARLVGFAGPRMGIAQVQPGDGT